MAKKKVKVIEKSSSQIDGCFATHHFVQVAEPSIYQNTAGQIGSFGGIPRTPRNPRMYCTQCGKTIELGA